MATTSPISVFLSAPPASRTLSALVFTCSVLLYAGGLPVNQYDLALQPLIRSPHQFWRLFTPFFVTAPGLGILFNTYYLYVYGAKLEISTPRFSRRAVFVAYIFFCWIIILLLNLTLASGSDLASPLSLAFITTFTLSHPSTANQPAEILEIPFLPFAIPSQILPYALLFLTLIAVSPQAALVQGTGVVAAHTYELVIDGYPWNGTNRN